MSLSNGHNTSTNGHHPSTNGFGPAEIPEQQLPRPTGSKSSLDATGEHAKILKVLDQLRDLGIDRGRGGHSLPQIIVCGSQSSGKSSVLEAIAGIPFPRKGGVCTKYKTQVTLLRKPEVKVVLGIIPDPSRPPAESTELRNFKQSLDRVDWRDAMVTAIDQVNAIIFNPKGSKGKKQWTTDTLTVTISGPEELDLQLLDLPGLIELDKYDDGNVEMVKEMVKGEMLKSHSIVLAVTKATDDIENHKILRMCKDLGIGSDRTLGVLTMPDEASSKAIDCVKMVQGRDVTFKKTFPLDWHVLVNRNQADLDRNSLQTDRDEKERVFFETSSPWNELHKKDTGIGALRDRLSVLLFAVAKKELPKLLQTLMAREGHLKGEMTELGGDLDEKQLRTSMKKSLEKLKKMARDHGRGYYESDIRNYSGPHPVHLRSRVVDQSEVFRDKLLLFGHKWDLEGRVPTIDPDADLQSIFQPKDSIAERRVAIKAKDQGITELKQLLNSLRKKGLPGFNNEEVINKAFWLLTDTWEPIAKQHINNVFKSCAEYFEVVTTTAFSMKMVSPKVGEGFGNSAVVAERYLNFYLIPALEERKRKAFDELQNLEDDRLDTCQDFDREFLKRFRALRVDRTSKRFVTGVENTQDLDGKPELRPADIARMQNLHTQEDWTTEAANDLLDAMWTHYEIACRQFVANVLMQIVERHLMRFVEEIVMDDLGLHEMQELVKGDEEIEAKKQVIRQELDVVTRAIAILHPYPRAGAVKSG